MVRRRQTKSRFETLSAVLAGKAELRALRTTLVIDKALQRRKLYGKRTLLFRNWYSRNTG